MKLLQGDSPFWTNLIILLANAVALVAKYLLYPRHGPPNLSSPSMLFENDKSQPKNYPQTLQPV